MKVNRRPCLELQPESQQLSASEHLLFGALKWHLRPPPLSARREFCSSAHRILRQPPYNWCANTLSRTLLKIHGRANALGESGQSSNRGRTRSLICTQSQKCGNAIGQFARCVRTKHRESLFDLVISLWISAVGIIGFAERAAHFWKNWRPAALSHKYARDGFLHPHTSRAHSTSSSVGKSEQSAMCHRLMARGCLRVNQHQPPLLHVKQMSALLLCKWISFTSAIFKRFFISSAKNTSSPNKEKSAIKSFFESLFFCYVLLR